MIKIGMIKDRARYSLERSVFSRIWLRLVACVFIGYLVLMIPGVLGMIFSGMSPMLAALIGIPFMLCTILVSGPISYSMARIYQRVARDDKTIRTKDIFVGFKENPTSAIALGFMRSLFTFLWALLLIIPGIVKHYAYSMSFFIQQESEGRKPWRQCLEESNDLTYGHKGRLFLLDLSFIGWYLLGYLCLGIGVMWVLGYHEVSRAHFYEELKQIKFGSDETNADTSEGYVFEENRDDDDDFYDYGGSNEKNYYTGGDIFDYSDAAEKDRQTPGSVFDYGDDEDDFEDEK